MFIGIVYAFEAKLAIQSIPQTITYPPAYQKQFLPKTPLTIITFGGEMLQLSSQCLVVPVAQLHDYLHSLPSLM